MTMAAQTFTVSIDGNKLSDGQTFDVGYTQPLPILAAWESVRIVSPEGGTFVCEASSPSDTYGQLQVCCGGECKTPDAKGAVIVKEFELKAGEVMDPQIHRSSGPLAQFHGDLTANVTIYPKANPTAKLSYTCNFVLKPASEVGGVTDVTVGKEYVRLSGKTLHYNGHGQLSVYSLLGNRLVSVAANGEGTVSLSHLAAGVYIYRLGGKSGKFTLR